MKKHLFAIMLAFMMVPLIIPTAAMAESAESNIFRASSEDIFRAAVAAINEADDEAFAIYLENDILLKRAEIILLQEYNDPIWRGLFTDIWRRLPNK